jgi:hypothetical protein
MRCVTVQVEQHVGVVQAGRQWRQRLRVDQLAAGQRDQRRQRAWCGDRHGRGRPRALQRS